MASIEVDGYLTVNDRSNDIIKFCGERISSVTLGNTVIAHPDLTDAAVIGARHAKWGERLVLIAVACAGTKPNPAKVMPVIANNVANWQVRDQALFGNELPRTATSMVRNAILRETFARALADRDLAALAWAYPDRPLFLACQYGSQFSEIMEKYGVRSSSSVS